MTSQSQTTREKLNSEESSPKVFGVFLQKCVVVMPGSLNLSTPTSSHRAEPDLPFLDVVGALDGQQSYGLLDLSCRPEAVERAQTKRPPAHSLCRSRWPWNPRGVGPSKSTEGKSPGASLVFLAESIWTVLQCMAGGLLGMGESKGTLEWGEWHPHRPGHKYEHITAPTFVPPL